METNRFWYEIQAVKRRLRSPEIRDKFPGKEPNIRKWLLKDSFWGQDLRDDPSLSLIKELRHYVPPLDLKKIGALLQIDQFSYRAHEKILVYGDHGSGISALLAYWYLTHADLACVYHQISIFQQDTASILRELSRKIARRMGAPAEFMRAERYSDGNHQTQLTGLIKNLAENGFLKSQGTLILVLDGLEHNYYHASEGILEHLEPVLREQNVSLIAGANASLKKRLQKAGHVSEEKSIRLSGLLREEAHLLLDHLTNHKLSQKEIEQCLSQEVPEEYSPCYLPSHIHSLAKGINGRIVKVSLCPSKRSRELEEIIIESREREEDIYLDHLGRSYTPEYNFQKNVMREALKNHIVRKDMVQRIEDEIAVKSGM